MQQDPIGEGVNWYAYAGNNPVRWVDPEGLADIYWGIEGELSGICGIDLGYGYVIDTDHPLQSGIFLTVGPVIGPNVGGAVFGGLAARDIEGHSLTFDANLNIWTPTVSLDEEGPNAVTVGWGRGKGASVSFTNTRTLTIGDVRDAHQKARRRLWGWVSGLWRGGGRGDAR